MVVMMLHKYSRAAVVHVTQLTHNGKTRFLRVTVANGVASWYQDSFSDVQEAWSCYDRQNEEHRNSAELSAVHEE